MDNLLNKYWMLYRYRKQLLQLLIITTLTSCVREENRVDSVSSTPPNIVLILADDLGFHDIGAYGQEKIETPHLDELAKNGMQFTRFYSGSPVCAPARCVLMTGMHSGHAYIRGNDEWGERGEVWNYAKAVEDPNLEGQRPIPDSLITMGEVLQSVGYRTACIGKWGLGAPFTEGAPENQGFDLFFGYNCQRQAHNLYPKHLWRNQEKVWLDNELVVPHTLLDRDADPENPIAYEKYFQPQYAPELMLDEAVSFIEKSGDSPFFLYFASPLPHLPLQAPKEWIQKYQQQFGYEIPYTGENGYFPAFAPRATYAAMVGYLDYQVGQIIETIRQKGALENTIILFTSDNGPTFDIGGADSPFFDSAYPFNSSRGWGKGYLHEGGIRVPLLVSWPGKIKEGSKSNLMSGFWDLLPTLATIAGANIDDDLDGLDISPTLFSNNQNNKHDYLYWEFPANGGQQAVRLGEWKGIRKNIRQGNLEIALYNLNEDLREENDVAESHPEVVQKIAELMQSQRSVPQVERFRLPGLDSTNTSR